MKLLATMLAVLLCGGQIALEELTLRADRLPAGCYQPAAPTTVDGTRVRGGMWAALPITSNPWIGSDPVIVAAIRERAEPPRRVADGPPPTSAELARARLRLAEDVEAAYAAVYADNADRLLIVYGLKFAGRAKPVTAVVGRDSMCEEAVAAHVNATLGRP